MAEKNSLWKNIRNKAKKNRETGAKPKQPTAEMLRQERKIKAKKAEGGPVGEDELPTYRYANKEGVIGGPRERRTGTELPVGPDGLPIVNMPEFEVISTGPNTKPNPYSPTSLKEATQTDAWKAAKLGADAASLYGFYPANVAGSAMDLMEGDYSGAAMGLVPIVGRAGKHGKFWKDAYTKGVNAGLPHKVIFPLKKYGKQATILGSNIAQAADSYDDLVEPYISEVKDAVSSFNKEQKATGGYYPTQGPPKALFKGYAEGGEDERKKRELAKRNDNTDAVTRETSQGLGLLAQSSEDFDNAVAPYVPTSNLAKQYYYNNYSPVEYPNPINAAIPILKTAWNLINPATSIGREQLKAKITSLSTPNRPIGLDKEGNPNIGEEAWKKALGLPTKEKYIVKSQYKPSSASDPNAEYYTINPNVIDKQKIIDYVKSEDFMKRSSEGKSPNSRVTNMDTFSDFVQDDFIAKEKYKNGIEDYYQIDPIQKFQISKAWDPEKKKWYASIYDKYDFDSESANKAIKPYEIYDRVYFDSNEKPIKQSTASKVTQAYGNPFANKKSEGGYTMKNNNKSWREYLQYAQGGYTNPYNQYQDDPYLNYAGGGYMYGNGGRTWKNIGAGAFGALEGLVDTTFGWIPGVDYATDMAYKGLQKIGGSTADEIREQDSIHGYAQTAGAVTSAILTSGATTGSAISEGAQGLGQGISKGNESEKWARDVGTGLNIAGTVVGTAYNASEGAKAAQEGFKLSQAGSQGVGKFAAAAPVRGFSAAPKGTMQGVIDGSAVSMKPGTDAALSSITPTTSVGTFNTSNIPNVNTSSTFNKVADVTSSLSTLPKSQEQPPMAEPVSVPAPPPLPPQTDYNQFAVNPPTINTGFQTPDYEFGYNPSLPVFSQGGNITNNSLNLRNTMRYKRFAQGGTLEQQGINFITDDAGFHHQNANGGVPIGPGALAEGGEAKLQMSDGGQYIVSDQVDGANTQTINGETMAERLKKKLKPFMMGGLASNPRDKDALRRPFDSYSAESIAQVKDNAIQETEAVRMQRGGALQYAANGGKLNKDIEKIVMEEYTAAYGGTLPNKYKGKVNMPNSYAKGGIHIKKSKKGTFTAAATKHGKSVQDFAKQVLANKENYSPEMVKKANFARNASKWNHADGGYVYNPMTQPMLAEGGPIYGDPASEYVYARGGMYGDPYARGGQIDYTNDMYSSYAGGGPMVGNAPQAFKGPAAQNRGGMLMTYADGGMMPQEQQMQQQGGQDQMMQMVQQIAQAIMQGANPEQLMAELEGSGMPPEQIQQVMQAAMQMVDQQQQQQPQGQPMQEGQQMPPQQGMARGGKMYYRGGEDDKKKKGFFNPANESQFMNYDQYGNPYYDDGFRPYNYTNDPVVGEGDYVSNSVLDQIRAARRPIVEDYSGPIVQPTAPRVDAGNVYEPTEFLNSKKVGPLTADANNRIIQGTNNSLPGLVPMDTSLPEDIVKKPGGSEGMSAADWGTMIGQLAGPVSQFFQKKPEPFKYQKAKPTTLDPTTAIILANQASREAQALADYNIKQNAPTSGSYLANIRANALQSGLGRGKTGAGIRQQYDINNAGILNQMEQYNTEIENRNIDAIQQDLANFQEQRTNALYNAGANMAGMRKDYKANQINEMIAKNLGTANFKYDPATQTFKYPGPDGQIITVPATTVIPTNPTNLSTGEMQQPTTPQFQSNFDKKLNTAFRNSAKKP